jgi:hypothetical protein
MTCDLADEVPGPVEAPVPVEEPDEHAWYLGIGAPTIRIWLMTDAEGEEPSAVEEFR